MFVRQRKERVKDRVRERNSRPTYHQMHINTHTHKRLKITAVNKLMFHTSYECVVQISSEIPNRLFILQNLLLVSARIQMSCFSAIKANELLKAMPLSGRWLYLTQLRLVLTALWHHKVHTGDVNGSLRQLILINGRIKKEWMVFTYMQYHKHRLFLPPGNKHLLSRSINPSTKSIMTTDITA